MMRVPTKTPLIDLAVRRAVERQAHVLQIVHRLDRFAREDLRSVLVNKIVAAFDGVVHVPFPIVFFLVSKACRYSTLCSHRMGTCNMYFADDGNSALLFRRC